MLRLDAGVGSMWALQSATIGKLLLAIAVFPHCVWSCSRCCSGNLLACCSNSAEFSEPDIKVAILDWGQVSEPVARSALLQLLHPVAQLQGVCTAGHWQGLRHRYAKQPPALI